MINRRLFAGAVAALGLGIALAPGHSAARDAAELDAAATQTLARLVGSEPAAAELASKAAGVLIFPDITKAGFIVGGSGGDGVLRVGGKTVGYYRSAAASFGLQAGVSSYGYVMFMLDQAALDYVRETDGWEVGVGPSVVVADEGFATKLSTTSTEEGIFVFFIDQSGFFAGGGIEGAKITPIAK